MLRVSEYLAMYRERERRFGKMPEPQWRILLDLVQSRRPLSTTSVAIASGAPLATALRHIEILEAAGWVCKSAYEYDRRLTLIALTNEARENLAYLEAA